jgi:hypothetical protein
MRLPGESFRKRPSLHDFPVGGNRCATGDHFRFGGGPIISGGTQEVSAMDIQIAVAT